MKKEKRDYVAPDTEVKHVEIESAICASSGENVDFKKGEEGVIITQQDVVDMGEINDFSGNAWDMKTPNTPES